MLEFLVHLLDLSRVNSDFNRLKNWGLNKGEVGVTKKVDYDQSLKGILAVSFES